MSNDVQQQIQLPLRKAIQIAWKNLRVRWWRSLLVTSGIILALAFLAYVLCSDALSRSVANHASPALRQSLNKAGVTLVADDPGARVQTRWMVGLALLVSFVGILNAMLMSVTERFAEIGTMKCLGALDSFIIKLFMLESVFQGLSGTAVGIAAGVLLALGEGLLTYGFATIRMAPGGEFLRIVGICLLAGTALTIAGALYPAWRAAKMQPVDAMRTEV
ncbi:MAG: FtsX-like permease family protein [Phycisphaerae bacterium]|nr:FtsX-like permease family protein [Phycisphaerae bacterium]